MNLAQIEQALREAGLTPRGAFHPAERDGVPAVCSGTPTRTLSSLAMPGRRCGGDSKPIVPPAL